jgi:hypothetical protein
LAIDQQIDYCRLLLGQLASQLGDHLVRELLENPQEDDPKSPASASWWPN